MEIVIRIDCDNAAFGEDEAEKSQGLEVARILNKLADEIESGGLSDGFNLRDINGNTVGSMDIY